MTHSGKIIVGAAVFALLLSFGLMYTHFQKPEVTAVAQSGPLSPPSGLVATTISTSQINLSWSDNSSDESNFRIERSTVGGGVGFLEIAIVNANITNYSDTGLAEDTTYYYRVRAYRAECGATAFSDYSNEANAKTLQGSGGSGTVTEIAGPSTCTPGQTTNCVMWTVEVDCQGLPTRTANVYQNTPAVVNGTVVLSTGATGKSRYSDEGSETVQTLNALMNNNKEVFEVAWTSEDGWWVFDGGYFNDSACAYAEVAQWIHDEKAAVPSLMCGHGNSGGAFQNAYALTSYGKENIFDMMLLSGGPPYSNVERYCFDSTHPYGPLNPGSSPQFVHTQLPADRTMYWLSSQGGGGMDYCQNGNPPVQEELDKADATSLVPVAFSRDYSYPNTDVYFLGSEFDVSAQNAMGDEYDADSYYGAITTFKNRTEISGTVHELPSDPEGGATLIRNILETQCQ